MSEETSTYMVAPDVNGSPPLAKRGGPKGLLPSTWLNRGLRVEYVDANGKAAEASGILFDWYPAGPVMGLNGAKALISWDRLVLCELVED